MHTQRRKKCVRKKDNKRNLCSNSHTKQHLQIVARYYRSTSLTSPLTFQLACQQDKHWHKPVTVKIAKYQQPWCFKVDWLTIRAIYSLLLSATIKSANVILFLSILSLLLKICSHCCDFSLSCFHFISLRKKIFCRYFAGFV